MATVLCTERLIVRDWMLADVEPFAAICGDSRVMEYVFDGEPWTVERTRQWIADAIGLAERCGYCRWAVEHRETGELLGFCGPVPTAIGAEIGWRLAASVWGQGYATEAARAVLAHCVEHLSLTRITALVQAPNLASQRVCAKLGMREIERFMRNGREILVFAIEREPTSPSTEVTGGRS